MNDTTSSDSRRGTGFHCDKCADPKISNFFHYFSHNFEKLKLKKLITICYKNRDADLFSKPTEDKGIFLEYDGNKNDNRVPDPDEIGIHKLNGYGAAFGAA